jgi:hypothetical protein
VVEIIITAAAETTKYNSIPETADQQLEVSAAFSRAHACSPERLLNSLAGIYFYCCCIRNIIITGARPIRWRTKINPFE